MTPKTKQHLIWFKGSLIKKYIVLFVLIVVLSLIAVIYFARAEAEKANRIKAHLIIEKALNEVENEKDHLRNYAQMIAKNPDLITALTNKNRDLAVKAVIDLRDSAKKVKILEDLWFQIHSKEMQVVVRSWNLRSYGMNLDGFRKGVMFAREHRTATVAIEAGRKLNIKAIAPIYNSDNLVGFAEVIDEYQNIIDNLNRQEIDFAVYMNRDLMKTAIDMQDFDAIGEFIIASKKTIYKPFDLLNENDLEKLRKSGFLVKNSRVFASYQLSDYDARSVGMIVASSKDAKTVLDAIFSNYKTDIKIDSAYRSESINRFEKLDLKQLITIRSSVNRDEIFLYNQAARKITNDQNMLNSLLIEERKLLKSAEIK